MNYPRLFSAIVLTCICCEPLSANPPESSYIFPAGGQQGKTVKVRVGGLFLYKKCGFQILGAGVKGPTHLNSTKTIWFEGPLLPMPDSQRKEDYPKDMAGAIHIDADATTGVRHWRLWTSEGVTPLRKFIVGHLPEVVEQEIDGDPIPAAVQHPLTINGRIFPRADVDVWEIDAKKGETFTCSVIAAGLDSPLDARLEIRDPNGRRIAENDDAGGPDPFVRFTATADGKHQIRIHDIRYLGGQDFVYRLTVTSGPHIDHVFPLGGRRGEKIKLKLSGQQLSQTPTQIELPKTGSFTRQHLTMAGKRTNDFLLELDDLPEHLESKPNENHVAALPAVLNGRIDAPGEIDRWQLTLKKGESYQFELRAGRLRSRLDGMLTIEDANGKQLAKAEAAGNLIDPVLRWKAPADGVYTLSIRDRFRTRGGPGFAYRLRATPASAAADFRLWLPSDAVTVARNGKTKLRVTIDRLNGFKDAVSLQVHGLPNGVEVKGTTIAKNRPFADLQFTANETVKLQRCELTITGEAKIADVKLTRKAQLKQPFGLPTVESLTMATAIAVPFKITSVYTMQFVPRGSVQLRKYTIERNGYDGPIEVSLTDKQARHLQGATGPKIVVPAGATKFTYPVQLPPWMEMGRTCRVCVMGVATVKDKDGTTHQVSHSATDTKEQFIAVVGPGRLALRVSKSSFSLVPNGKVDVQVRIERAAKLKGAVALELIAPNHIDIVRAKKVVIPAGENAGTLTVVSNGAQNGAINMPLTIRATLMDGERPVIAEAEIEMVAEETPQRN